MGTINRVPFLKPNLVRSDTFLRYLQQIEGTRIYSNYGPLNSLFENRVLDQYFQGSGAVTTVCNATVGLMLAISQSKRSTGRYALMPSFTFPATPLAAMWCGLEPYFLDIREDTWCVDEHAISQALHDLGDQIALVVPYATFGTAIDLSYYSRLVASGFPVVIDAAASFGTLVSGEHFGRNFPGCIVFSFHATKPFGIGEGGLVYSGDVDGIEKIRRAANFGFSADRESCSQGLNGKLSEYAAAIALATLDVFEEKIAKREKIWNWYVELIDRLGMVCAGWSMQQTEGRIPHQFLSILCPRGQRNTDCVKKLAANGIEARTYFCPPCHLQHEFSRFRTGKLISTDAISHRVINLPFWEEMTYRDVEKVIGGLWSEDRN